MSLYGLIKGTGANGYGYNTTAAEVVEDLDLSGKRIVLTGCNSGLGHETMRVLAARGATVVGAARTLEKAQHACDEVRGDCVPAVCELSDPASVQACVDAIVEDGEEIDAIICNAGIMALPDLQTSNGYELQFFTNHVGHFILVTGLLDILVDDGRVVMVSSEAHRQAPREGIDFDNLDGSKSYSPWTAYGRSKLANILFAKELSRRFEGTDKTANALHPGVINTNLSRHMNPLTGIAMKIGEPLFLKSTPQGAATQTYVAVHPHATNQSGQYFSHCNVAKPTKPARDMELAAKLWERTEEIVEDVTAPSAAVA